MTTQISEALRDGHSEVSGSNPGGTSPRNSGGHVVIFLPALNEEHGIGPVMDRIPRAELEAAPRTSMLRDFLASCPSCADRFRPRWRIQLRTFVVETAEP